MPEKTALVIATEHDHPTMVVCSALRKLPAILQQRGFEVTALLPGTAAALSSRLADSRRKPPFDLIVAGAHGIAFDATTEKESRQFAGKGLTDGKRGLLFTDRHCVDFAHSTMVLNACLRWDCEFPKRLYRQLNGQITILGYRTELRIGGAELWRQTGMALGSQFDKFAAEFSDAINSPVMSLLDGASPQQAEVACRERWNAICEHFVLEPRMSLVCKFNAAYFMHMDHDAVQRLQS